MEEGQKWPKKLERRDKIEFKLKRNYWILYLTVLVHVISENSEGVFELHASVKITRVAGQHAALCTGVNMFIQPT